MSTIARPEVLAALGRSGAFTLLDKTVLGVEPRDENVLVLVEVPWFGGTCGGRRARS